MNFGTIIRTALRVAVSVNTACYVISASVGALNIKGLSIAWAVITVISDFVVAAITTYYNNDYTIEGAVGTGITRQLKAEKRLDYIGERFSEEMEDEQDDL